MTKENNNFKPKIKIYHILLLGALSSTLLILNSNHVNNLRAHKEYNQFNQKYFKRKLDETQAASTSEKASDKVCKLGSKELVNYYKTGNLEEIGLKEGPIECKDKNEDYMKALIDIVKSLVGNKDKEGDNDRRYLNEAGEGNEDTEEKGLTDNLLAYGKHIIEVGIFLVIGVLSIPGWLMCVFCCCGNCCCCCCCKKPGCKKPCFIISFLMYALVVSVCIYGLSKSNHIFVGLADTECSLLKFVDEILEGESKEELPKWAGVNGIKGILTILQGKMDTMNQAAVQSDFDTQDRIINGDGTSTYKGTKKEFLEKLSDLGTDFYNGGIYNYYLLNYNSGANSFANGNYVLDMVKNFGTYDSANEKGNPENSLTDLWITEFKEVDSQASSQMENTQSGFDGVLGNADNIRSSLGEGITAIDDIDGIFADIKSQIFDLISDNSETIDKYGRLGVKLIFSVLGLMNIAIAVVIFLYCFCSGESCAKCCCCHCLLKIFAHLLWNILALLMIIVILVGSLFTLIGKVGSDGTSIISYLVSEDNLGEDKDTILLKPAKKYLIRCFNNGDGKIEKAIFTDDKLREFDKIKTAEQSLVYAKGNFTTAKENLPIYNNIVNELEKRQDLSTDQLSFFKIGGTQADTLNLGSLLRDINNYAKNKHEKWDFDCDSTSASQCTSTTPHDNEICYKPKDCLPSHRYYLSSSAADEIIKAKVQIVSDMKTNVQNIANDSPDTNNDNIPDTINSFKDRLVVVKEKYYHFIDSYTTVLDIYIGKIREITSELNRYSGVGGETFGFINCKFIGKNVKVILNYLKDALGKDLYTVGVCLVLSGCSIALSIISTILLIIIINTDIAQKKTKPDDIPVIPFVPK